jgi:hypothetical protein
LVQAAFPIRALFLQPQLSQLAHIAKGSNPELRDVLRNIVRGLVPSVLCGWILVDGLRTKNVTLLVDLHTLGIDSFAIDCFSIPIPRKNKLEDPPKFRSA